ncbi:hypothetical protein H6P81_000093 [Aristolochia fimbriata]|uniref:Uncharacterized protein n=1 Tax=Aristolochia fimbriata TaxID=158543 RepID=A0AAV7F353_ARIFI|nr:hypothetical protein H6P81_000093 [Aristolochia fimbriata]
MRQLLRQLAMVKLSRRWRPSRRVEDEDEKYFIPTRDEFQPIDTREQEEIVQSYEKQHRHQEFLWRAVFSLLVLSFVMFLIYSIVSQILSPWELRYHAYFMDEVESWMIISAECSAVLACFLALKGFALHNSTWDKKWVWYSCYIGLVLGSFWLYHMLRMPRFRWDTIWLPLGPLSVAGLCFYVDHLLMESLEEVRKLRGYMYAYKGN